MREIVHLACTECKRKNYITTRRKEKREKMEVRKYCRFCRRHTLHKESR